MGSLDNNDQQHIRSSSSAPPTSAAGDSRDQSVDAYRRPAEPSRSSTATAFFGSNSQRARITFAVVCGAISLVAAMAAQMVGGFASVVLVQVAKGTASGAAVVAVVAVADALLSAYRSRK